jgi:DNA-binding winged helix-turn-helix (wHTH) protein
VTFGGHRLDLATRQLFRGSDEVHLSPKSFELLRLLLEHRPRALSKTELHDQLWPATFVSEANLASIVAEVRRALRDDSHRPTFIRTVHGFGYAFAGAVDAEAPVPAARHLCWIVWRNREWPLRDGENIVGRDPAAVISLDFPSVSRRHARLVVSEAGVTVEDLGSKNGTLLRQTRVTVPMTANDRDELQVGSVQMTIRLWRGDDSTQTVERDVAATNPRRRKPRG